MLQQQFIKFKEQLQNQPNILLDVTNQGEPRRQRRSSSIFGKSTERERRSIGEGGERRSIGGDSLNSSINQPRNNSLNQHVTQPNVKNYISNIESATEQCRKRESMRKSIVQKGKENRPSYYQFSHRDSQNVSPIQPDRLSNYNSNNSQVPTRNNNFMPNSSVHAFQ